MSTEIILIAATVGSAAIPIVVWLARIRVSQRLVVAGVVGLWTTVPVALAITASRHRESVVEKAAPTDYPIEVKSDGYIGSDTCKICHPNQYHSWHASYHRTMTQEATRAAVMPKFKELELAYRGGLAHMSWEGDKLWLETSDPNWSGRIGQPPKIRRPIVMTTGSHHMQAFWVATGKSRIVDLFDYMYLREDERWVPKDATFLHPHSDQVSDELGRWNTKCIRCHVTHGMPHINREENVFDTKVGEFGISCEACHGPGEQHAQANRDPQRRYAAHLDDAPDPTIVLPSRLSHQRSSQVCGQCHSIHLFHNEADRERWWTSGAPYRPGDDLGDTSTIVCGSTRQSSIVQETIKESPTFLENRFWSDGMVRVVGREYNGLVESPCHQRGEMSCLSCHNMHQSTDDPRPIKDWANDQLKQGMDGDQACLDCHAQFKDESQHVKHTHHPLESSGSRCYNCHMPHTTYGLLKAVRSHQVSSPNVAESAQANQIGRPNACNQCHLDKTLAWSADHLDEWFDIEKPELSEDEQTIAASVIWSLQGDAGQRALTAWTMGWPDARTTSGGEWTIPYLAFMLRDSYDAVRYIAARSLSRQPGLENFRFDGLASQESRDVVSRRILGAWNARQTADKNDPSLLQTSGGQINEREFQRLLELRDHRIVNLAE